MVEMHAGQGGGPTSKLSRRASIFMIILGAVAAVIGFVLLLLPSSQASFGWFAYAPLSNRTFFPSGLLLSPTNQIGTALFIVGLTMLAFGAGWLLGQRQTSTRRRHPNSGSQGT